MAEPSMHQPDTGTNTRPDPQPGTRPNLPLSIGDNADNGDDVADDGLATGPIPARAAYQLAMDIEHLGVDSAQVHIVTQPAHGANEVGRVDQRTVSRPARRAALGAAAGAGACIGLGLVAMAVWSLPGWAVLIAGGIVGASLGGLWSVYGSLATNVGASDLETGHWAVVHVAVDGLDLGTTRIVRRLVRDADASARRTPARQGADRRANRGEDR